MEQKRRPGRVPPICEHCCGMVETASFTEITVTTRWPGCEGRRVFFHTLCFRAALAALPQQRLPDRSESRAGEGDTSAGHPRSRSPGRRRPGGVPAAGAPLIGASHGSSGEPFPRPGGMEAGGTDAPTRVLVLANRTADSDELLRQILARHDEGRIDVTMLAPAVWEVQDPHGGRESALRRLRAAQKRLHAAGIDVSCVLGDPDPMTAFEREWRRDRYDEIIVSTLPRSVSRWLHLDLPHRIGHAAAGVPITHVIASPRPADLR